jgi:hypothetical protein
MTSFCVPKCPKGSQNAAPTGAKSLILSAAKGREFPRIGTYQGVKPHFASAPNFSLTIDATQWLIEEILAASLGESGQTPMPAHLDRIDRLMRSVAGQ